jgi:hypothetical protein
MPRCAVSWDRPSTMADPVSSIMHQVTRATFERNLDLRARASLSKVWQQSAGNLDRAEYIGLELSKKVLISISSMMCQHDRFDTSWRSLKVPTGIYGALFTSTSILPKRSIALLIVWWILCWLS